MSAISKLIQVQFFEIHIMVLLILNECFLLIRHKAKCSYSQIHITTYPHMHTP